MSLNSERIKANNELLKEKINLFERELILETDVGRKFKLEQDLKDSRNRLEQLNKDLIVAQREDKDKDQNNDAGKDTWKDKKEHWQILIASQEIEQLFREMKETIKTKRQYNMVIQMMANYNMILKREMLNIEDPTVIERKYNQTTHNLLGFIDSLEERHTREDPF